MTNDNRERLVELLEEAREKSREYFRSAIKKSLAEKKSFNSKTDVRSYILANGVIIPPCKVGDTVYYVSKNPINISVLPNTIYEAEVIRIVTTNLGTSLVIQIHNEYGVTEIPDINDLDKTVFLTKEEAVAKLRKEQNNEQ